MAASAQAISAQVKALQADLQARSGAATVMEPVNVPPPPTLAVDPAGVPNPPVEPTDEIVEIDVKSTASRVEQDHEELTQDVDTKRELGEMVEELRCYGMALSEGQLQSVSDGSGFTRQINKVRDYINSHETACFNRSYRNATTQFAAQWDKYAAILGAKLQCEKMESLKFTLLRDTVVSKDIYSLLDLNLKYRNVVYEFFDWFDAFVIRGDREGLVRRTVDVALNIDMSVLNGASDVMSIVNTVLTSFKGSNINKETIIAKLASIAQYVISYAKAEARRFRKPPENPPYRMNEAEKAAVKQAYQAAKAEAIEEFGNPELARTKEERTALMKQVNGAALRASATLGAQIRREGGRGGVGWSLRMPGHHDANPHAGGPSIDTTDLRIIKTASERLVKTD
ncbi:hypothetical protein PAPYR_11560 [Paratrimastix pyriformis]|uniref:Virion structural protein n=1 Tax=Paratrimastix pyriformis TaxID=342808 RepID=A0ABQ8U8E6_9EUKA|nr:hypothetical protein PAPYR_11560 [Paratrimastix pyriformis]